MTGWLKRRRELLIVVTAGLALAASSVGLSRRATSESVTDSIQPHPKLFAEPATCPVSGNPLKAAHRLEERAQLRSDRYAYDPRDGVLAVLRYREAEACYRAVGAQVAASRLREVAAVFSARVDTDYAAARLNLVNALEQERWRAALSEIRRLLLLTDHLGRHAYVQWLESIIGEVAARAGTSS